MSTKTFTIKKFLFWSFVAGLLLVFAFLTLVYFGYRKNPVLMRFTPIGGLPENYTWELKSGADFDVYYASKSNNESSGIGIYLGNMPNFDDSDNLSHQSGTILGKKVSWVVQDGSMNAPHAFYRTTLFEYRRGIFHTKVHIWVYASDREEMDLLLSNLKSLRLKPTKSSLEIFLILLFR